MPRVGQIERAYIDEAGEFWPPPISDGLLAKGGGWVPLEDYNLVLAQLEEALLQLREGV